MHRAGDVLDLLHALVLESEVELVAHLVAHHPAHADPAGLGQGFEAGGNIDAVAEDVLILDDDVADIDLNAEFDASIGRHSVVALGHPPLHFDRAPHRINHARELDQHPVAGSLDDATMMFSDLGIDQFAAMPFEPFVRPFLIRAHETRVAHHIGGEDRGKATKGRHRSVWSVTLTKSTLEPAATLASRLPDN